MISRSMLENTFFYYFCGNLWETDICIYIEDVDPRNFLIGYINNNV